MHHIRLLVFDICCLLRLIVLTRLTFQVVFLLAVCFGRTHVKAINMVICQFLQANLEVRPFCKTLKTTTMFVLEKKNNLLTIMKKLFILSSIMDIYMFE